MAESLPPAAGTAYNRVDASDRSALIALCTEYAWRVDNYQTETVPELFLADGVWEAFGTAMIGRDALIAGWNARATIGNKLLRRHHVSNFRFARTADGVMRGWHALTYYQGERGKTTQPTLTLIGEYENTFGQTDDGTWLFKSMKMVPVFPDTWASPTPTTL